MRASRRSTTDASGRRPSAAEAVTVTGLDQGLRRHAGAARRRPRGAGRRARGPARAERVRQDHPAARDRRARAARRRARSAWATGCSRAPGTVGAARAAPDRDGLPGRRPLPAPERGAQRRLRPAAPRPRPAPGGWREALALVGLDGLRPTACPPRSPAASSSGWPWRARWRPRPSVILLDEPFSNLDAPLRAELRLEVRRVLAAHRRDGHLRDPRPGGGLPGGRRGRRDRAPASVAQQGGADRALRAARHAARSPSSSATPTSSPAWPPGGGARDAAWARSRCTPSAGATVEVMIRPERLRAAAGGGAARSRRIEYYGHDAVYRVRLDDGGVRAGADHRRRRRWRRRRA